MKQVSFIHTADLHLDAPFSSLSDADKANMRRKELENCFRNIVSEAHNVNLFIISGDFFEDKYIRGTSIQTIKNLFSELYKTEIVLCPGNHDPLKENSPYRNTAWGNNVYILENTEQVLYLEKYNTCIYNLGSKGTVQKDLQTLKGIKVRNDCFNILLFHGTVDMPFEELNYNSVSSKDLFSLGMDYIALGHMHNYSQLSCANTLMINPGSPEPLGFDEEGQHGYIKGTLFVTEENKKSIQTAYLLSAARQYHNIEVNVTGCSTEVEIIQNLLMKEQVKPVPSDLYSITLKGFIKKGYIPDIGRVINEFEGKCFYIKIKNQTSTQFEFEEYLEDPGIKGEFVRRIIDSMETARSEEEKETLFMALQYGLQAMEGGRIEL